MFSNLFMHSDPVTEYDAAFSGAVLIDYSHASKLRLTGNDAPMFLGNLSTNDIKSLPLGGGCPTYFCDSRGKTLFQAWVYHIQLADKSHALWLETNPGRNAALAQYLDKYRISEDVEIEDVTAAFAQFHLAGPKAVSVLEAALADRIPPLAEFQHMERTIGNAATCNIRRRDPLGIPGFDIVCSMEVAEGVCRMLIAHGAEPASLQLYRTLRIEAGTPLYGEDIDENRFVMEIGDAARAVSFAKGCFLGQEPIVMSRDRAGHAPRSFVGLQGKLKEPLPAGAKLFLGNEEVGVVTSSTYSRRASSAISLGYVRWKHREPGTVLEVEIVTGREPVTIVTLPLPM